MLQKILKEMLPNPVTQSYPQMESSGLAPFVDMELPKKLLETHRYSLVLLPGKTGQSLTTVQTQW